MNRLFTHRLTPSTDLASLTPLVDVFTLVLIAVLQSWSVQPPVTLAEDGMQLPISRIQDTPTNGVLVDVGASGVHVNGWRAASSTHWSQSDSVDIPPLGNALHQAGGSRALIRADTDAPWRLVGKVLFTVQQAGYSDVELVALSPSSL
jgi:biopolymer transport protein ExbD